MDPGKFIQRGLIQRGDLFKETGPASPEGGGERLGRYELLTVLGEGGSAIVYQARDLLLNRDVALKRLKLEGESGAARFLREAELLARLSHPGIIPIFDLGQEGKTAFFTMPMIGGGTLQSRIGAGRIDPAEAARIIRDAADAVQHAHDNGIIHRDLKPSNIMLDEDGRVKVADFGLGRREDEGPDQRRTHTGTFMGTLYYVSPEQANGDWSHVGPLSDVYSLGATLYEAAAGRPPLQGDSVADILRRINHDDPRSPRHVNPAVPWELEVICLRAMDKDPGRRYESMREFSGDLGRFLRAEPIHARRSSILYRIRKQVSRNRKVVVVALLGTAAVAGTAWTLLAMKARDARGWSTLVRELADPLIELYEARQCLPPHDMSLERAQLRDLELQLRAILDRDPDAHEARIQIGRVRRRLGDLAGALAAMDAGIEGLVAGAKGNLFLERARVRIDQWAREVRDCGHFPPDDPEARERLSAAGIHVAAAQRDLQEATRRGMPDLKKAESRLAAATLAFARKEFDLAVAECDGILGDPGISPLLGAETWKLKAHIAFDRNRPALAADHFASVYAIKQSDSEAYIGAANARVLARMAGPDAVREIDLALKIDSRSPMAWLIRFHVLRSRDPDGPMIEALRSLDEALTCDPDFVPAYNSRASLKMTLALKPRVPREAILLLDQAIADHSRVIDRHRFHGTYYTRGMAHGHRAKLKSLLKEDPEPDFDAAIRDYGSCLDLNPEFLRALCNRGLTRVIRATRLVGVDKEAELDRAVADLTRAIDEGLQEGDPLAFRALAHSMKKQWREAVADYERALERKPDSPAAPDWRQRLEKARRELDRGH